MRRRTLLATLAAPGILRAETASTLTFVPVADVTVLDPFFAGPDVTAHHAAQVWDTLYAMDDTLTPQFQMLEGHTSEDGGRRWRITVRWSAGKKCDSPWRI